MEPTTDRELGVLLWVLVTSFVAIVGSIFLLVRSGRAVPLPMLRLRAPPRRSSAPGRIGPNA